MALGKPAQNAERFLLRLKRGGSVAQGLFRLARRVSAIEESAALELAIGRRLEEMDRTEQREGATRGRTPVYDAPFDETPGAPAPAPRQDETKTAAVLEGSLEVDETLPVYEQTLATARAQAEAESDDSGKQYDLTVALEDFAANKLSAGDSAAALAAYQESLDIRRRMTALSNNDNKWLQNLSATMEKIGDLHVAQGDDASLRRDAADRPWTDRQRLGQYRA